MGKSNTASEVAERMKYFLDTLLNFDVGAPDILLIAPPKIKTIRNGCLFCLCWHGNTQNRLTKVKPIFTMMLDKTNKSETHLTK
jgi:hypothetical protein